MALLITTSMLQIVAVTRSMVGAYVVTRDVTDASSGWVLGVMLVFIAFVGRSTTGVYRGVDQTGRSLGLLARHLFAFYATGLFVGGAVGGRSCSRSGAGSARFH